MLCPDCSKSAECEEIDRTTHRGKESVALPVTPSRSVSSRTISASTSHPKTASATTISSKSTPMPSSPKAPPKSGSPTKSPKPCFLLDRAHDLNLHILCEPFNVEGSHRIGYVSAEPLPNMALYKNRMQNAFERYTVQLKGLQVERKELEENEIIKAGVVAEACALTETKFEPEKLGFDFSRSSSKGS